MGWSALLIETEDVAGWRAELTRRRHAGELVATEIVPGERTVLLDGVPSPDRTAALIAGWTPSGAAAAAEGPVVELPTVYDGEDLPLVARHWGMSVDEVVERHTGTGFRVAFCGFAPGFGYLTGLPAELHVPRLATPRTRVPSGAVGLAGEFCGVYPRESPGGWRLIAVTDAALWDPAREPAALLSPGSRVRFVHR